MIYSSKVANDSCWSISSLESPCSGILKFLMIVNCFRSFLMYFSSESDFCVVYMGLLVVNLGVFYGITNYSLTSKEDKKLLFTKEIS